MTAQADRPGATRVLIVDDDPIFVGLASACLSRAGIATVVAGDGVEGLELIERDRFDVAVVDLMMPRIDGLRMIALIRGAPRHDALAILVVSGTSNAALIEEALRLGADAAETKPVNWSLLPARVEAAIAARRPSPAPHAGRR